MPKTTRTSASLKQLLRLLDAKLVSQLLGPIWRIAAAVHLFFPTRDHAGSHGEAGAATGVALSRVGEANCSVGVPPNRRA